MEGHMGECIYFLVNADLHIDSNRTLGLHITTFIALCRLWSLGMLGLWKHLHLPFFCSVLLLMLYFSMHLIISSTCTPVPCWTESGILVFFLFFLAM